MRRTGKPVVLIANKAEGRAGLPGIGEAYRLGLGDPVPISAEHGEGLAELYERLTPFIRAPGPPPSEQEKPLELAIVGRPNVGKSTLINRLIGVERLLTGPEAEKYLAENGRALPALTAEQTYWFDTAAKNVVGAKEAITTALRTARPYVTTPNWATVAALFEQYAPLAFSGSQPPDKVLETIQQLARQ